MDAMWAEVLREVTSGGAGAGRGWGGGKGGQGRAGGVACTAAGAG